jgi:hypothetical protein
VTLQDGTDDDRKESETKVTVPAIAQMELRKIEKMHVRIPGTPSGIRKEYLPNVSQASNIALTVLLIVVVK